MPARQLVTVSGPARLQVLGPGAFRIQSWKGQAFKVKSSPDLQEWAGVATLTNLTGTLDFAEPTEALVTERYYRVVSR